MNAAGQVALAGPRSYQRKFLISARFRAAQRDYDTALHGATVKRYILEATNYATQANDLAAAAAVFATQAAQSVSRTVTGAVSAPRSGSR
ncbi:hypothetical protein [Micromonospora vulcania]|uniref:Uncharacterized protein n=1 Tax=Micromonospora vulcania TaxID=1441873 RepID=A0ABW1H0Y7_9ACTN